MPGKTRKQGATPRRTSTVFKTGREAERQRTIRPKGGSKSRTTAKPKKSSRPHMTREVDERIRAATSRRPGASTTKKSATFAFDAPSAGDVSIAGSFNNWESQAMTKGRDGLWRVTLQLEPGTHQYKFLVDTQWREDPSNPRKTLNESGSFNSICEVR